MTRLFVALCMTAVSLSLHAAIPCSMEMRRDIVAGLTPKGEGYDPAIIARLVRCDLSNGYRSGAQHNIGILRKIKSEGIENLRMLLETEMRFGKLMFYGSSRKLEQIRGGLAYKDPYGVLRPLYDMLMINELARGNLEKAANFSTRNDINTAYLLYLEGKYQETGRVLKKLVEKPGRCTSGCFLLLYLVKKNEHSNLNARLPLLNGLINHTADLCEKQMNEIECMRLDYYRALKFHELSSFDKASESLRLFEKKYTSRKASSKFMVSYAEFPTVSMIDSGLLNIELQLSKGNLKRARREIGRVLHRIGSVFPENEQLKARIKSRRDELKKRSD